MAAPMRPHFCTQLGMHSCLSCFVLLTLISMIDIDAKETYTIMFSLRPCQHVIIAVISICSCVLYLGLILQ